MLVDHAYWCDSAGLRVKGSRVEPGLDAHTDYIGAGAGMSRTNAGVRGVAGFTPASLTYLAYGSIGRPTPLSPMRSTRS